MTTIKFDLYEELQAEKQKNTETLSQYTKGEEEAQESHAALVKEYENMLKESVESGKDVSKELDEIDSKIDAASKLITRRQRETSIIRAKLSRTISNADIVGAYRTDYVPKVRESVLPSYNERLEHARNLILSAVTDLKNAEDEYKPIAEELQNIASSDHFRRETGAYSAISQPFQGVSVQSYVHQLVDDVNGVLTNRQLPEDATYLKGVK